MTKRRLALAVFVVVDLALVGLIVALFQMYPGRSGGAVLPSGSAWFDEPPQVAEFTLTDQQGRRIARDDLLGRWHLMFFGFTSCPDVCPMTMQGLARFYRGLEGTGLQEDTGVIMVSVDPLRDTPEVMAAYINSFDARFIGLTGEYPQIEQLAESLFVSFTPPQRHQFAHEPGDYMVQHSDYVAVLDPDGRYRGVIHAPHTPERLDELYRAIRDR